MPTLLAHIPMPLRFAVLGVVLGGLLGAALGDPLIGAGAGVLAGLGFGAIVLTHDPPDLPPDPPE